MQECESLKFHLMHENSPLMKIEDHRISQPPPYCRFFFLKLVLFIMGLNYFDMIGKENQILTYNPGYVRVWNVIV
jgi:hypothetical protein